MKAIREILFALILGAAMGALLVQCLDDELAIRERVEAGK